MSAPLPTTDALLAAAQTARQRRGPRASTHLLSVVLLAVFFLALLAGLVAGARTFHAASVAHATANELHVQAGLITNAIRGNDASGTVATGEGPEGTSLVLVRSVGERTYETRIYLWQGNVVQETSVAGNPYSPQGATPLMASSTFDVRIEDGLVTFSTDGGEFCVALRSEGGAA